MQSESTETAKLIQLASDGNTDALNELFTRYRDRLRRIVELRLDWRLRSRIDPSDVLQDAYVQVVRKLTRHLEDPKLPFFLWLRLIVGEQLINTHRTHLGVMKRDASLDVPINQSGFPAASSAALAAQLLGQDTSPSEALERAERLTHLQNALDAMEAIDREVLTLRHFEQLTTSEAAIVLEIEPAAAAKRYVRAIKRLRAIMSQMPGGLTGT